SSSTVTWPTIEICAPVARRDEFLVMVERMPPSHAFLIRDDKVLPCRSTTASTPANSGSVTIKRLSETPGSIVSQAPSFAFHFLFSSRTSLMRPSPEERPPFVRSLYHRSSASRTRSEIRSQDVPFRAFDVSPTRTLNRFGR